MKMTVNAGVSSISSRSVLATATAMLALVLASQAHASNFGIQTRSTSAVVNAAAAADPSLATSVYSTGFETNTNGASLTTANGGSWTRDGSGAAVVTNVAALVESGAQAAQLTPVSTTDGTWLYRPAIANPTGTAEPVITTSIGMNITSPATTTATRSVFLGLQLYDVGAAYTTMAGAYLMWNGGNNITGLAANELVLQFEWGGTESIGYTFGALTSAQLASVGYFDVSVSLDYSTGVITFGWGNATQGIPFALEATQGSFSGTGAFEADIYYQRGATGGVLPRLAIDNFSITSAAPVPEPETWALMLGGLAAVGMLARRRKPA